VFHFDESSKDNAIECNRSAELSRCSGLCVRIEPITLAESLLFVTLKVCTDRCCGYGIVDAVPRWTTAEQACALCADRAYTPSDAEAHALIPILAEVDRDQAEAVVMALARSGPTAAKIALQQWTTARAPLRARLIDVLGRVVRQHDHEEIRAVLVQAADDADLAAARKAIVMLGKLGPERRLPAALEARLIQRFADAPSALQRAITEALGKAGSQDALAFLRQQRTADPEQNRLQARATLMLERERQRAAPSQIIVDARLPQRMRVALNCRVGLSRLLSDEIASFIEKPRRESDRVSFDYTGDLNTLLRSRIALDVALIRPLRPGTEFFDRVLQALSDDALQAALRTWTEGALRFRIHWVNAGRGRGATWRLADRISQHLPQLLNDPVASCWECRIDERRHEIAWLPRTYDDPRFTYREADVPAASHPTLAAALARQAAPQKDDVVWDPFVGSGLELIEIDRQVKVRALLGTDTDERALDAARKNLTAAGISHAQLILGDARSQHLGPVTLIVSNPPMGRRVARDGALLALLDDFLNNARGNLAPNGRVVWLSPQGEHTARRAQSLGFTVHRLEAIDLGGFEAELQVLLR
jgi:predicted RNA methylase